MILNKSISQFKVRLDYLFILEIAMVRNLNALQKEFWTKSQDFGLS